MCYSIAGFFTIGTNFSCLTALSSFHKLAEAAANRRRIQIAAPEVTGKMRPRAHPRTRYIARELEKPEAAQEIFDGLERAGMQVEILVNKARHGQNGKFWEIPIERDIFILRLNLEPVLYLTKLFLPPMIQCEKGRRSQGAGCGEL